MRHTGLIAAVLLLCAGLPCQSYAQESTGSGPRFQIFRYASRSALGIYTGYSVGPVLMVGGMLVNPRTEYREAMAAVGVPLGVPGGDVTIAVAGAHANTGWYAQLYLSPSLRFGAIAASATFQLAQPLEATGSRGLYASPVNVLLPLNRSWAAGIGYYGSIEAGSDPYHGVGPALQRAIPSGSVTLEWVFGVTGGDDEVRATVRTAF
jgi:hypothetical protein